jgi:hypothetical protein
MAKTAIITILLIVAIVLLVYIAARPQTTVITTPVPQPIVVQPLTPRAPQIEIGVTTPKAPATKQPSAGIEIEKVLPQQVDFYVNDIRVPESTTYEEGGLSFIPIKKNDIKTFAGSFGPYFKDPTPYMKVVLCAEYYKIAAAPSCEVVQLNYQGNHVTFARGYQFDEYIGGMAAKDYAAYYTIYAGEAPIGYSNKAIIRTVNN